MLPEKVLGLVSEVTHGGIIVTLLISNIHILQQPQIALIM